ncbi:uncharacterized protein LOC118766713 isoform X2 [Octopus sinensis]|uniref:Uncharacterized protein LOC118766713 isoform X2 n=1 Tax=Octopus sinensis TaxID=2607531 RepID=A0A7E6FES3_9MOLL|nr:uncharacterized protein LOC118766713 isoform X2 [Octopus sinensis]
MLQRNCFQIIFLFYISLTLGNGLEYLKYFLKVENCLLKEGKTLMTLDVDDSSCSKRCFEISTCKSFVSRAISPSCILYEDDATEKALIQTTNTYFYQLRRSVPTKYTDGRCPVDFIYNSYLASNNDLGVTSDINYRQCFYKCEAEPTCQSFDYNFNTNVCYMSTYNHTNGVLRCIRNDVYIEINRKLWNDLNQPLTLEKINSVGCDISVFDSYYFVDKKEINGQTAYSTFSFKPNPYHNLVTEAQMDARSVLDCSRLCMVSSTCTAFSYTNTKCQLKKLVDL